MKINNEFIQSKNISFGVEVDEDKKIIFKKNQINTLTHYQIHFFWKNHFINYGRYI